MAYIAYTDPSDIPEEDRVMDTDNIIQIHGVHSRVTPLHYELYHELMHGESPLTRIQREMIAVMVSALNGCHY